MPPILSSLVSFVLRIAKHLTRRRHRFSLPGMEITNPHYVGATAVSSVLTVADAAARLALSPAQALGKSVVQNDGTAWLLKTGGNPVVANDWVLIGSAWTATALGTAIHAATAKPVPVDADELPLLDSAGSWSLKKFTWANCKAALKAFFDNLYAAVSHTHADLSAAVSALANALDGKVDRPHALLVTNLSGANNNLVWTALASGAAGEKIRVAYAMASQAVTEVALNIDGDWRNVTVTVGVCARMIVSGPVPVVETALDYVGQMNGRTCFSNTGVPYQGNPTEVPDGVYVFCDSYQWCLYCIAGGDLVRFAYAPLVGGFPIDTEWTSPTRVTNRESSASQVMAAAMANPEVAALVGVNHAGGSNGTGSVTSMAITSLHLPTGTTAIAATYANDAAAAAAGLAVGTLYFDGSTFRVRII